MVLLVILVAVFPCLATAESSSERQDLLVERVQNGFALTPDFKFTQVDGEFANLAGGYGGWINDHRLLLGAGGYWLTNGSRDLEMWYGGGVVEWFATRGRTVDFSIRGLVGGGSGTLSTEVVRPTLFRSRGRRGLGFGTSGLVGDSGDVSPTTAIVAVREAFFVIEPQANLYLTFTSWLRVGVGASYRAIAGAGELGERLRGVGADVALQFGSF